MTPNPLFLLVSPLISQLFFGQKSIAERIRLKFYQISLINFTLQLLCSFWTLNIVSDRLKNAEGIIKCGMPLVGIILFEILLMILLLIIISIQYSIKRYYIRKAIIHK
ncbi:hypothetical protein ACFFLS_02845 [Flavobacterium procerum]|uniref:DUF4870 domain-containing protein n=1 Tax=Flavobacterium procerum TaxID=1455569 RepID=A0ABV6BKJ6_9FLAO